MKRGSGGGVTGNAGVDRRSKDVKRGSGGGVTGNAGVDGVDKRE